MAASRIGSGEFINYVGLSRLIFKCVVLTPLSTTARDCPRERVGRSADANVLFDVGFGRLVSDWICGLQVSLCHRLPP